MPERRATKRETPGVRRRSLERTALATQQPVALDGGWRAELQRLDAGAVLRIAHPSRGASLELKIRLTEEGPVVCARASAIEIESEGDLVARCDRFRVEAQRGIELVSSGGLRAEAREVVVRATHGSALVNASDDVQLLGEQVLLNCDRPAPLPPWVAVVPAPEQTIARRDEGGDADILALIDLM